MASDDKRVTIKKGENQVGTRYALVHNQTKNTYDVWIRRANYNGKTPGGIAYTWRYVQMDMDQPTAESLYNRKLQGKTK